MKKIHTCTSKPKCNNNLHTESAPQNRKETNALNVILGGVNGLARQGVVDFRA